MSSSGGRRHMIKIEYPAYRPRIRKVKDKEYIFDEIRKRWVVLTPEEWVRQNVLQYIIYVKKYPASLIAVEKEIKLGELKGRFDIVVYDINTRPWMIIECKEMNVGLTRSVLDQGLKYNMNLKVPYLVITNGIYCMAITFEQEDMVELDEFPVY